MAPTNKKMQGRQTNNSLSSMTEHILIPLQANNASETSRKKKTVTNSKSTTEIFTETEEVLQIGMHKVLEHVKNHDDAWPFMDPVEEDIAPRYYSIIRRPMDLQRMEEKLDSAEYNTFSEFKNDFKLIVNNCRLYNGQNNEYTEMVNNLQIAFEKATRKYFDQSSSDEETFFDFLDVKHDAFHEKVLSEKIKNKKLLQLDMDEKEDDIHVSKKRKNGDEKHDRGEEELVHKSKKPEKKSGECCNDPKKESIKKSDKQYDSPCSNKIGKTKIDYDDIETCVKKKDKKKIIKEIKKKHKEKGKIKGKIKKERGRPKGSHKHKTQKVIDSKASDASVVDNNECFTDDDFSADIPPWKEKSEKKHKKEVYKLLKKEKEKKFKYKNVSKKSKKYSIDNDHLSDVSLSEFDDVENLRVESQKKISSSSYRKGDKKLLESKDDEKERDQKLKKKSKKKQKKILEEAIGEVVEKRKPGRPKVKHLEKLEGEYKKEKKKKQKDTNFERENKESNDKNMDEVDPYNSVSELSEHSLNNNFNFDDNSLERPLTPDIIDKYDLIKQRRRQKQSEDSRSKQSSERSSVDKSAIKKQSNANDVSFPKSSAKYENNNKNSHGSSEEKKLSSSSSREPKNHRLQETIEKLKKKSKKNKKENALLDEIFGVKPAKNINDEKSIYKKIRETYGGEKESGSQNKIMDVAAKKPKNICEYDFIDDIVISKDGYEEKSSNQKSTPTEHSFIIPSKKKEQGPSGKQTHKNSSKSEKHHQKCVKKQEKANMEALELETEQTLKDINKWLELTPHMSEFGSASSSPSRYIIDDLDAVPTRTDDFIRTVPILEENQENHQNLNSQFDALKNDGKVGLHDHNVTNKQTKASLLNNDQKTSKVTAKQELKTRKTTKLLNYVPPRKREHQRTIDRLQPGKSKGNLLSSVSVAKKFEIDVKPDLISTKVKEIKNSLIVETSEGGPKLSLGTVLDSEGFGLIQQHNFQNDKPNIEENDEKPAEIDDEESPKHEEHLRWGDVSKKEESVNKKSSETSSEQNEEENDKKKDEPKPNLSAWFKAFGIPKKQQTVPTTSVAKDGTCGDSLSQTLGVANNLPQPTMRQRKSSTGSTTSELSSVSQDPDSPRITIDESYTGSYKSPIQLPIVTSPKAGEFSPRQQAMSNYEINGPIKVGFYQDITKCSPDKSPQQLANTTPQYSMAHRTPPNPSLTTSLQNNFSYYTKADNSQLPSATASSIDSCHKQKDNSNHENSDYSGSPNNPRSPYQNQPMSPYLQNPQSPFTSQSHSQQSNPSKSFVPSQNMQSILPCSSHSSIPETEKYSTLDIDKTPAALPQSEKHLNNNEQKHIQPPTYTSTPQFSLANLPKQSTETSKTPVMDPAIPGSSDINTPHYTDTNISSTSNHALNIKISDQSAWPPQGLYGPNIDKNLFPLSLTNTTTSDLSQNQSNNNGLTQSQSQELCNNQSYSQMFGFDSRQKKQSDCMNTAHSALINDPVSLVAKNQDSLRKQQSVISAEVYDNKTPIDYANPSSDRYKNNETYNSAYKSLHGVMQGSKNQNTFDTQTRQQTKLSMPSTNISKQYADHLQQQQSMFGNNRPTNYLGADPVDLKSSAIPHSNHPKPLDGTSQNINPYGNNYITHGQQSQNPPADYTMGGAPLQNARYTDLSRQTPASHQHSQMDAYKNTAYIRNFASMMAEMGLPPTTQNPYSQSMAHQFAKTFHQVTTAALQQFLPGSAMTTTAYSKSSREDDTRSASSKGFPTTSQQTSSSSVISQYLGSSSSNPGTREASLTSQQQQHMVAYQQKFSEAANMSQGPDIAQGLPVEIKHTSTRRSSKSSAKKSKQSPQVVAHVSQQEMLLNSGMAQTSSSSYPPQTIPSAHNFPPYGASNISGKIADNLSNSGAKVGANSASSTAGSAFNFTPTPSLPLPGPPPGLYAETTNYLEDFRGTTNPYYPIAPPTGHRNTTEITADKTNTTPGNTPTVSAPYHQFLPHPSTRTGYPFMNPASFDPLQQQWNLQREEQLRAQMMLASNPYSQSGYPRHLWG